MRHRLRSSATPPTPPTRAATRRWWCPLVLLAVAVGITRLPGVAAPGRRAECTSPSRWSASLWVNYYQRTQSADVARRRDRTGPARRRGRVLPRPARAGLLTGRCPTVSSSWPTPRSASPERVDWVDYAERNGGGRHRPRVAEEILAEADGHAVFMVWMSDYRTFGDAVRVAWWERSGPDRDPGASRTTTASSSPPSCTGGRRRPDQARSTGRRQERHRVAPSLRTGWAP